jgi:hypothetical protein
MLNREKILQYKKMYNANRCVHFDALAPVNVRNKAYDLMMYASDRIKELGGVL